MTPLPTPAQGAFTKGPWRIRAHSKDMSIEGRVHQIADPQDFPTAFIPAWDRPGPGEVDGAEEARANARLIAASPDLHEAATWVMRWSAAVKALSMPDLPPEQRDLLEAMRDDAQRFMVDLARAALAKATGTGTGSGDPA